MVDATELTPAQIVELFEYHYSRSRRPNQTRFCFYCGITNDEDTCLRRHEIDSFLITCETASQEIAAEVEGLLHDAGYDTGRDQHGGNGGVDDSVFVYMYMKGPQTNEGRRIQPVI